jgi:hypothetical protein
VSATTIEGASARQAKLLDEILEGMPGTGLRSIRLSTAEAGWGAPGDLQVKVDFDAEQPRAHWDAMLVAAAFAYRSQLEGLPQIAVWAEPTGASTVEHVRGLALEPAQARDGALLEELAKDAAGRELASLEVVRPFGYAPAVKLQVDEPHSYLRHVIATVCARLSGPMWEGSYVEVVDRAGDLLWLNACSSRLTGCRSYTRRDVECCGRQGLSTPLEWQPPECPVFR